MNAKNRGLSAESTAWARWSSYSLMTVAGSVPPAVTSPDQQGVQLGRAARMVQRRLGHREPTGDVVQHERAQPLVAAMHPGGVGGYGGVGCNHGGLSHSWSALAGAPMAGPRSRRRERNVPGSGRGVSPGPAVGPYVPALRGTAGARAGSV